MFVASVLRKVLLTLGYPKYIPDLGPYKVGAIQTRFPGCTACQIHYPASTDGDKTKQKSFYPYFRPKAVQGLANYSRQDPALLGFLSDKNHPSWINADPLIINNDHNDDNSNGKKFPVILFSHGLGGCMEMYTQLCQQIASYGFLVVAMEHEDGSGAYAETNLGEPIYYKKPDDSPYSRQKVLGFRRPFLKQRVRETTAILDAIMDPERLLSDEAKRVFQFADTSKGVALLGHSFGGASMIMTAQEYLSKSASSSPSKVHPVSLSVLDPWAFSLEEDVLNKGISSIPTLAILSQAWLTNPEVAQVDQFLNHCPNTTSLYVPHAVHASFADSVSWLPGFVLRKLRMRGANEKKYETIQSVAKVCVQQIQSAMTDGSGHIEDLGPLQKYNFQTQQEKQVTEVESVTQILIES